MARTVRRRRIGARAKGLVRLVGGNRRITFRLIGAGAEVVDDVDYLRDPVMRMHSPPRPGEILQRRPRAMRQEAAFSRTVEPPGRASGAWALGAVALGAFAVGALAIGAVAIGKLSIGRARIRRLEIDELVVRELRVTEELQTPPKPDTASES